jgi:cystathionine gamma-synthase
MTTTFERAADGSYPQGHVYSRDTNPNRLELEENVRQLEGGTAAAAFASGSAAAMTLLQALSPGDHVIAPVDFYFGIRQIIQKVFIPWGLQVDFVDVTNPDAVQNAMRENTRLIILETPSNPLLQISDVRRLAEIAHDAGALLAVDNTVATPINQRPLELGADFVIHATTKYIGGHSDILGGMIVAGAENDLWGQIVFLQRVGGVVPSPFECWLALRGIQTLPMRAKAHSRNAMAVAQFLEAHPAVEKVHYPGLESHVGHDVAARQMDGFGGVLSFLVKGGQSEAMAVAAKVQIFTRATSFGGTHSLIEHRASVEAPDTKTPVNLLRCSIGLEHPDDLIEDLRQALQG